MIEYQKQGEMVTEWKTREKLTRTEQSQNDICNEQSNTLILDKESSEESDEEKIAIPKESSEESDEEKIAIPRCNNRYNLRQDIRLPKRYGKVYTHLVDICHGQ